MIQSLFNALPFSTVLSSFCVLVVVGLPAVATGQQDTTAESQPGLLPKVAAKEDVSEDLPEKELELEQQKALVNAIYNATKKAKTEKDYTEFLKQCEDALAAGLSSKNGEYVNSLIGWALNRRGEKRFELALQLEKIENRGSIDMLKRAHDDFDRAVIADPNRHRSWMSRGIARMHADNYDQAIEDFTKVIKLKPDESNGWFNRAEALYERSKPASFVESSTDGQDESQLTQEEILKQQKLGYEQAVADYDVVLRLDSNDTQALTGRAHANFALGNYALALSDYEQVVQLVPGNATAFINRADVHQRLENWQLANSDYKRALSIEDTSIACQRAAWFMATCPDESFLDPSQALTLIKKAIELEGDSTINLDTLAAAEAAAGNFEAAKKTLKKVIGLVSAESTPETKQYQARLALYENGEPFTQSKAESNQDDSPAKSEDD